MTLWEPFALDDNNTEFYVFRRNFLRHQKWLSMLLFPHDDKKVAHHCHQGRQDPYMHSMYLFLTHF